MDMFQIDWWHEEVDKMEQGFGRENVEYISTFYKNVSSAIDKIKYGIKIRKNEADKKYVQALREGADEQTLRKIERKGNTSTENKKRLEGLETLAKRFVKVQVASLSDVLAEYQTISFYNHAVEEDLMKVRALMDLKRELELSGYYECEEQEEALGEE